MSVIDAAKRLALRQEGGVTGLAARMKVNPNTLLHKLASQSGHNLFARELEAITLLTGDAEIAQELAFACNHVCIPVAPTVAAGELGKDIAAVGREFGELMKATQEAIDDGSVTERELAAFDVALAEFLARVMALRGDLKKRIPAPPGLRVAR